MANDKAMETFYRLVKMGVTGLDSESFCKGYRQALLDIEQEKAEKTQRKTGKFFAKDFLWESERLFTSLIHYETGKEIVTDGHFLLFVESEYDKALENQNTDKDGIKIDYPYPKWQKVVPSIAENYTVRNELKDILLKADSLEKGKSMAGLYNKAVKIEEGLIFSFAIIRTVKKFLNCFPQADCYINTEDKSKALVLKTDGGALVFMPYHPNYKGFKYIYSEGNFTEVK